jgi:hypothetical protein
MDTEYPATAAGGGMPVKFSGVRAAWPVSIEP